MSRTLSVVVTLAACAFAQAPLPDTPAEAADKRLPDHHGGIFFRAVKNLTADGYYTSHVGLIQELGYKGNMALERFPEAEIPEH